MARPVVEYLIGAPLTFASPYTIINPVCFGVIESASAKSVVIEYQGAKLVLRGSFEIDAGGQVVAGTVTGFEYSLGASKIVKGSGYAISYADLDAANFDMVGTLLFDNVIQKGSSDMDYFYSWSGNGTLLGGDGSDWLFGNSGDEKIKGGAGNDVVAGRGGTDKLWGGTGKDVFVFGSQLSGKDMVKDFQAGKDTIGLEYYYFEPLGLGALGKGEFAVGKNASADRAQVIYNKKTGMLYYDEDGLGVAPKIAICELSPKLDLKASDIFVGFWD